MKYEVYGPFSFSMDQSIPWKDRRKTFWDEVEETEEGLSKAIGIYVFSIRHGETYTPWYVGKTAAKTGFRGEVFQGHQMNHYIATQRNGERCMHLIAKVTASGKRFCKKSDKSVREVELLETTMIGMALQANPKVRNSMKTWFAKTCRVPGLIGPVKPGAPTLPSRSLRAAFKLG